MRQLTAELAASVDTKPALNRNGFIQELRGDELARVPPKFYLAHIPGASKEVAMLAANWVQR